MAFRPTILFAVANEGTTPRILAVQTPQVINANAAGVTGFALAGTVSLADGTGTALAGTLYHTAFTITWDGAGLFTGKIAFNRAGFDALNATFQSRLIKAFATGGKLVVSVDAGLAAPLNLPITLAALRTSDFVVDGGGTTATPAYAAGVVGPNLAAPAAGSYAFACTELGAGALTVTAAGVFTVSAAAAPANLFNRSLTITTNLTTNDGAGNPFALVATGVLPIDLHLHTECLITLDRSGSMGAITPTTDTKWNEAVKAASLFSTLYGGAIPQRSTPNGTVLDNCVIRFGRWRWLAAFDVGYQPSGAFEPASTQLAADATLTPGGGTPIGQALVDGDALFTAGKWRRRHLLLLTDGMDNAGTPTLQHVMSNPATDLPRLSDNLNTGVIVHTVSYALTGDVPVIDLHALASGHGGIFLGSEADSDTYDADKLRDRFLNVLAQVLPIQLATNSVGDATFDVDDGVERVIFIAPGSAAISATSGTDATNASGTVGGLTWAAADDPEKGVWTVTGASSSEAIYAVYDVSLQLSHELEPHGLGRPIKVRARLQFRGEMVSGADVWVGLRRPGESIGDVITTYIRSRGLARALQPRGRPLLSPDLAAMLAGRVSVEGHKNSLSAAVVARGVSAPNGDTKSLQRLLLEAAERARNLDLQNLGNAIQLLEVAPGVYEAEIPASMTQEEGVYDFAFLAEGLTPAGNAFKRTQRRSLALAPLPSLEASETLIQQVAVGPNIQWTATVLPRTVTGRALGPGLGYALAFHYASDVDRKKLGELVTVDNLDGTYATQLLLPKGEKLPALLLALGPDLKHAMPVDDKRRPRQVKVRLEKIQVLDDHDGCLTGAGELVFDTVVAPNANPVRAVRTRLPASGVLKVNSGQTVTVNEVIYEGLVEAGANLSVTIGGRELDYLLFFRREEKLARYHRTLPLKSAHLAPGDEPNDPEALSDWKVWYTVEVE